MSNDLTGCVRFGVMLGLGVTLLAGPALAAPLPPGTTCVVEKPLQGAPNPGGKGKKIPIPKGTQLTVQENTKGWAKVTSGDATLYVAVGPLSKSCKPVVSEAPTEPPPAPPPETPPAEPPAENK
jgi:hypothetical protein